MLFLDWYINMQKPDIVAFTTATVMRHDDVIIVVHKSTMSAETKARQPMQQICQNMPEEIRWQLSSATCSSEPWHFVLLKHLETVSVGVQSKRPPAKMASNAAIQNSPHTLQVLIAPFQDTTYELHIHT